MKAIDKSTFVSETALIQTMKSFLGDIANELSKDYGAINSCGGKWDDPKYKLLVDNYVQVSNQVLGCYKAVWNYLEKLEAKIKDLYGN